MSYQAPVKDMLFNIRHLAGIDQIAQIPGFEDAGYDTAQAVLEECAKFNEGVVAPLNVPGDRNPSSWKDGIVTTTPGFAQAYKGFAEGGWQGLQHPVDYGGQGLPKTIGAACIEMVNSANLSFALCPLLTDGAIEALLTAASDELKSVYLEKLVSGEWTGTMNLTEPQAGSDLAAITTRAEPDGEGGYRLTGQWKWGTGVMHADWVLADLAGSNWMLFLDRGRNRHQGDLVDLDSTATLFMLKRRHVEPLPGLDAIDLEFAVGRERNDRGFAELARRRGYYPATQGREDAIVMRLELRP
mgnify:CR=1 FL=1